MSSYLKITNKYKNKNKAKKTSQDDSELIEKKTHWFVSTINAIIRMIKYKLC